MKKIILIILVVFICSGLLGLKYFGKENLFGKEFEKGLIKNDFTTSEIKDIENIFQEVIKEIENNKNINSEKENTKECLEGEKLWINKYLGFKSCIPYGYLGFGEDGYGYRINPISNSFDLEYSGGQIIDFSRKLKSIGILKGFRNKLSTSNIYFKGCIGNKGKKYIMGNYKIFDCFDKKTKKYNSSELNLEIKNKNVILNFDKNNSEHIKIIKNIKILEEKDKGIYENKSKIKGSEIRKESYACSIFSKIWVNKANNFSLCIPDDYIGIDTEKGNEGILLDSTKKIGILNSVELEIEYLDKINIGKYDIKKKIQNKEIIEHYILNKKNKKQYVNSEYYFKTLKNKYIGFIYKKNEEKRGSWRYLNRFKIIIKSIQLLKDENNNSIKFESFYEKQLREQIGKTDLRECGKDKILWNNRMLGTQMCLPFDYTGFDGYGHSISLDEDDSGVGTENFGYFSEEMQKIYIGGCFGLKGKKYFLGNKSVLDCFDEETKKYKSTEIFIKTLKGDIFFNFNKNNKEHIEIIKSIKILNNKEIRKSKFIFSSIRCPKNMKFWKNKFQKFSICIPEKWKGRSEITGGYRTIFDDSSNVGIDNNNDIQINLTDRVDFYDGYKKTNFGKKEIIDSYFTEEGGKKEYRGSSYYLKIKKDNYVKFDFDKKNKLFESIINSIKVLDE